jgi:hypothetical protein
MEVDLNIPFSKGLTDPVRALVARAIWGEDEKSDERLERLMLFFEYYRRETMTLSLAIPKSGGSTPIQTHGELIRFISLLKANPQTARQELKNLLPNATDQNNSFVATDIDAALDLCVRLMFMTACRSQNAYNIVATMQIFRPKWKEQESLGKFVERVYPLCDVPDQGSRNVTIRAHKLTAHYLKQYLNIQIQWTDHLSDHLLFQKGDTWKSLYVFCHPSVLEVASKTLAEYDVDTPTNTALSL